MAEWVQSQRHAYTNEDYPQITITEILIQDVPAYLVTKTYDFDAKLRSSLEAAIEHVERNNERR